jgi:putative addiction module antidote
MSPRGLIKCPLKLKPRAKGVLLKRTATSTRDLERVQVMDTWIPDIRRLLVSSATISNSELPNSRAVITIVITCGRSAVVELKVRKFGNSLGVVLPKEVINRLHTRDGEPLFLIEASEGGYLLTPYDPGFEEKMAKAEDIISRYRNTLHVLAK